MDTLPEEILLKVFHLLPVADLCRSERYVSWYFVLVRFSFSIYFTFSLTSLFVLFIACGKSNHLATGTGRDAEPRNAESASPECRICEMH